MFNERFGRRATFTFKGEGLPFVNLDSVIEENGNKPIEVKAVFINYKSKLGASPCLVTSDKKINLPLHLTDMVARIISEEELVNAINEGKCVFIPYQYTDKFGNARNSGTFHDA